MGIFPEPGHSAFLKRRQTLTPGSVSREEIGPGMGAVDLVKILTRIAKALDTVTAAVVLGLLAVMLITTSAGVFWRYALNSALSWSEELGRYLLVWISFLGAAMATYRGAHIGISAFVNLLPRKSRVWIARTVDAIIIVFVAAILLNGITILPQMSIRVAPTLMVRMDIAYSVIPVSAGIILFHLLVRLIAGFKETSG